MWQGWSKTWLLFVLPLVKASTIIQSPEKCLFSLVRVRSVGEWTDLCLCGSSRCQVWCHHNSIQLLHTISWFHHDIFSCCLHKPHILATLKGRKTPGGEMLQPLRKSFLGTCDGSSWAWLSTLAGISLSSWRQNYKSFWQNKETWLMDAINSENEKWLSTRPSTPSEKCKCIQCVQFPHDCFSAVVWYARSMSK